MKCENFLLSLKISYFFVQSIDSPDICERHLFSADVRKKTVKQFKKEFHQRDAEFGSKNQTTTNIFKNENEEKPKF